MIKLKISLKNYRGFGEQATTFFTLEKGFLAFVGPNNSGKSSLLKLFFELRNIFDWVFNFHGNSIIFPWKITNQVRLNGVDDPAEIFNDINNRPIEVIFDFSGSSGVTDFEFSKIKFVLVNDPRYGFQVEVASMGWAGPLPVGWADSWIPINKPIESNHANGMLGGLSYKYLRDTCREFLNQFLYVGPFRNAITEGTASYFDLQIGTSFISTWNSWKTGPNKNQNKIISKVTEDIKKIFRFNGLEINSSQDEKSLKIIINGKPYNSRELGSGLMQFIIVLGNAAIKRPEFILIDEPELNLHPSLQIDFLTSLASYAKQGIIMATHSIGLARSVSNKIIVVQKDEHEFSTIRAYEGLKNLPEFLGEMGYSAYEQIGFNRVLLVEGITEVKVFQQLLRHIKKDHETLIIPLGGRQFINGESVHELNELKRITKNIYVIIDSEKNSKNENLDKSIEEFQKMCTSLGLSICVTEKRATENYFPDYAIKEAMNSDKYVSLKPYERLREASLGWAKEDNWRIARSTNWEDVKNTDIGKFLESI